MSPEFWIGVAGIAVTLVITIGGGLIAHIRHDEQREARLTQVERELGDHDSGIRGELHKQVNLLSRLRAVVYFVARKLSLDIMKDLDDK